MKDHLMFCDVCCEASKAQLSADDFKILKKCRSDFDTKIQEALYIKKPTLSLTSRYMLMVLLSYGTFSNLILLISSGSLTFFLTGHHFSISFYSLLSLR